MAKNDFRRVKKLGKYLKKEKKRLILILLILLPVALAGAIQPLLVGQAISVLRGEPTFSSLQDLSMRSSVRILVGFLFVSVLVRLALQGYQTYNIQAVGQRLTARIRDDLFSHSMSLSYSFMNNNISSSFFIARPRMKDEELMQQKLL